MTGMNMSRKAQRPMWNGWDSRKTRRDSDGRQGKTTGMILWI